MGGGYEGGDAAYWQQLMATITQAAQARVDGFFKCGRSFNCSSLQDAIRE